MLASRRRKKEKKTLLLELTNAMAQLPSGICHHMASNGLAFLKREVRGKGKNDVRKQLIYVN